MIYPGVYYCVRAPISGMADLLCRKARRAIILALEEYKPAYNIALRIASCLDLSQIQGELAEHTLSAICQDRITHRFLICLRNFGSTLQLRWLVRIEVQMQMCSSSFFITKVYWVCAPKESRIPRKPSYHKAIPSTSFAINDEGVHPAFLLASGLSLHIPWMLMPWRDFLTTQLGSVNVHEVWIFKGGSWRTQLNFN
jgi:hypothetical protein